MGKINTGEAMKAIEEGNKAAMTATLIAMGMAEPKVPEPFSEEREAWATLIKFRDTYSGKGFEEFQPVYELVADYERMRDSAI